jgi:hypothetical protein
VTEFTATSGQTTFSVPSYTVGYVDVYRNGVMLGTADFTASSGTTIVLASGATAGDLIRVESFYVSSVLNAIQATAGAVNTSYITDDAVTQAKVADGVAGTGPAFSVWASGSASIASNTFVKIALDTETFDTANCFDSTTNYRFTPNVAGYYQINGRAGLNGTTSVTTCFCSIYKNGSRYKRGSDTGVTGTSSVSDVVYLNGSTDYVELYLYQYNGGSSLLDGGEAQRVYLSGAMVRAA